VLLDRTRVVALFDAVVNALLPAKLVAYIRNVYDVNRGKLLNIITPLLVNDVVVLNVMLPGVDTAVYEVIGKNPVFCGPVNETIIEPVDVLA
jgi:hypothetical protein